MLFYREQLDNLKKFLAPNKVVVLYGPRRVGKTTLIKTFLETNKEPFLLFNGEDLKTREEINIQSVEGLKNLVGEKRLVIIDEAQKIENIGLNLKIMVDHIDGIKIIATGSSSFDLARQIGEPLVGRKSTLLMFPLAQMEFSRTQNKIEALSSLENRMVYGSYPEIATGIDNAQKQEKLREIVSSYLYKDILEMDGVRNSNKIYRLLQLLAFQIGKEVSLNELGRQLEMNRGTVDRYLDLLEKSFVIKNLRGFSRNLRKEVSKNSRYYFYDNGIRNAIIGNLNPIPSRDDVGMLWENYVIMERFKKQEYARIFCNNYFWRTYDQKEIDLVEETGGKLFGYEFKWSAGKNVKAPKGWQAAYPNAEFSVISPENYLDFII